MPACCRESQHAMAQSAPLKFLQQHMMGDFKLLVRAAMDLKGKREVFTIQKSVCRNWLQRDETLCQP